MTYLNFKKYLSENANTEQSFDLMPNGIKSKLLFAVGEGAANTVSFLSAIMDECKIPHSIYIHDERTEPKFRFVKRGKHLSIDEICQCATNLIKSSEKEINAEELQLLCALNLLDDTEYLILEMSEKAYKSIIKSVAPFALILTADDQSIIDNAPSVIKEIIYLTSNNDYDYISSKKNKNGARITCASQNKRTIFDSNVFGTYFYHYDYLYQTKAIDLDNIPLAHLAIESATAIFSAPRPLMRIGISKANPINDLTLYSLSPAVLFREGENDFQLFHNLKFKVVTENDKFSIPTENTVFCGSKNFIKEIKRNLK